MLNLETTCQASDIKLPPPPNQDCHHTVTEGVSNLTMACQGLARVLACLYLSAKLSTPLYAISLNTPRYTMEKDA